MKRFKFSLQAVHNLREMRRDEAERQLGEVMAELARTQSQLDNVIRLRQAAMDNYLMVHQSHEIDPSMMITHTEYINSLMQLERRARAMIAQAEKKVSITRESLTEASRQSETTANLRERHRERHHQEIAK